MKHRIFKFWRKPETWNKLRQLLVGQRTNYILSCQDVGGGFGNWPNSTTYLETCYYALVCLGLSGAEQLCRQNVKEHIIAHHNVDGGFGDNPSRRVSNIFNTYYASVSLGMLESLGLVDQERLTKYLLSKRRIEGGFSEQSEEPASMIHTFWAISVLDILGSARTLSRDSIADFILSCEGGNKLFGNFSHSRSGYLEYTAYALILDEILNLNINFDYKSIAEAIERCRIGSGYSSYGGDKENPSDTFWALYLKYCMRLPAPTEDISTKHPNSLWDIFVYLILALIFNPERVLPNRFLCHSIMIEEQYSDRLRSMLHQVDISDPNDIEYYGFELYKALPLELKIQIKSDPNVGSILDIPEYALDLPWEIMLCGDKLLALAKPLARCNATAIIETNSRCSHCLLIYDDTLPSCNFEKHALRAFLLAMGVRVTDSTFGEFTRATVKGPWDLIHLTGHCIGGGLAMGGATERIAELAQYLNDVRFRGLFVCNCCNDEINLLKTLKKCSYSAINYFGVLSGREGHDFMLDVYKNLFSNNRLGEALRLSKNNWVNRIPRQRNDFLYYQLWGNPNIIYECSDRDHASLGA